MKKILSLMIVGIFVLTVFGAAVSSNFAKGNTLQKSIDYNNLIISEFLPSAHEYQIVNGDNGQKIEVDGFNYLMEPGKPLLPSKNVLIALPIGAKVHSVNIIGINAEQLQGYYSIMPTSYISPLADLEQNCIKEFKDEWHDSYESVYSSDDPYPSQPGKLVGSGTLRKYSYVLVSIYPLRYHPKSGRLFCYDSVQIIINYELSSPDNVEEMKWDTLADQKASSLFVNYDDIKNLYEPQSSSHTYRNNTYNYVIITTSGEFQMKPKLIWNFAQ